MATTFSNKTKVSEISVPGPATLNPTFVPVQNAPGPASVTQTLPQSGPPTELPFPTFNDPAPVSQNTLGGEDLNERVQQTRQDDNAGEKPYSVGLYEIDEALGYYFTNVLKPMITNNNESVQVPVIYGSPERWAAMTSFGAYRDNKGKILLPLIMYRKTNMAKNDSILFPRLDQLYYVSARKWDSKNRYDNFASRFKDLKAVPRTDKYALTALPNYVNISYECIVWTPFIEQMNKLIEKIQFSDFSYWGDPKKFKFRIILDAFDTAVELAVDTERMVKSTFTATVYGYILPEDFSNKSTTKISLGPRKIVFHEFGEEPNISTPNTNAFTYDALTNTLDLDFNTNSLDVDLNTLP